MAMRERIVAILALGSCALIAAIGLPVELAWRRYEPRFERTAIEIETRLRHVHDQLYFLELRDSLLDVARHAGDTTGFQLLLDPELPAALRARLPELLEPPVHSLASRAPTRSLVIAVVWDTVPVVPGYPWTPDNRIVVFPPAATDGNTCLSIVANRSPGIFERGLRIDRTPFHEVSDTAGLLLGLCSFLVAFGDPGPAMEAWLAPNHYAQAALASWLTGQPGFGRSAEEAVIDGLWCGVRGDDVCLCAAGIDAACRSANFRGSVAGLSGPVSGSYAYRHGWRRWPAVDGGRLLSDLVTEIGVAEFAALWGASLDDGDAFKAATGESRVGWMRGWARARIGTPRTGPAAPASSVVLAIVLAGTLVAGAIGLYARREVS